MTGRLSSELEALIGEEAFILLVEAFGGTRLYVPTKMTPEHEIVRAIGPTAAKVLAERMAPDVIHVPLARERRARQYRAAGRSNAEIARSLGMTEKGVEAVFRRMADVPVKGSGRSAVPLVDPNQGDLFR